MTWPGTQHGLISIMFAPGEVAGYDAAVRALENGTGPAATEQSSSRTTIVVERVRASQFPTQVPDARGIVHKPTSW